MNDDDATTVFDLPALEEPPEAGQRRGRHARTRRVPVVLLRRPTGRHVVFASGAAVVFGAVVGLGYLAGESWEVPRPPGAVAAPSTDPEPAEVDEPTGRPAVRASSSTVTAPRYPHRRVAVAPSPRAAAPASPTPTTASPSPSPSRPLFAPPRTPTPTPTPTVSTSPAAP